MSKKRTVAIVKDVKVVKTVKRPRLVIMPNGVVTTVELAQEHLASLRK